MNTDKINTAIRMIVELINALPIPAFLKALTKFSKYSQLDGGVITFVLLYSASVFESGNYAGNQRNNRYQGKENKGCIL